MKPGDNCGKDYDPHKMMVCRKCPSPNTHHEFSCFKYKRFNKDNCSNCKEYKHLPSDCQEIPRFPPRAGSHGYEGKN